MYVQNPEAGPLLLLSVVASNLFQALVVSAFVGHTTIFNRLLRPSGKLVCANGFLADIVAHPFYETLTLTRVGLTT